MRFVADENVDLPIVEALRAAGHEVLYVAEEERGLEDENILRVAAQEAALLITSDKDFGELVFRQGSVTAGILLLRLSGLPALEKVATVLNAVNQHQGELAGAFAVLTPALLRVRHEPFSPGS